ncbi:MAG: cupredoxin domain-containing protein [Marinibacterium sp.]
MQLTRRKVCAGAAAALVVAPPLARARDSLSVGQVAIRGFAFEPPLLTVPAGAVVDWVNDDVAPHTATGDDGDWDTGALNRSQAARIRFDRAGAFDYFCAFHPHMRGRIVVTA